MPKVAGAVGLVLLLRLPWKLLDCCSQHGSCSCPWVSGLAACLNTEASPAEMEQVTASAKMNVLRMEGWRTQDPHWVLPSAFNSSPRGI